MTWAPVLQLSNHVLRITGFATALTALVATFVYFLHGFTYLPGADAYYYALQAQSLLLEGHLKVSDHAAFCYAIAALARSGLSIEAAIRAALMIVFSVYQLGMFLLVLRVKKQSQLVTTLLWALSSPFVAFHTIEFPTLTLGLATLPAWFWLATKPIRRWAVWLVLLLAAAAFVHPAAAAIAVIFAVMLALGAIRGGGRRFFYTPTMILAGCAALLIMIAFIFAGLRPRLLALRPGMPGLPGLLNAPDVPIEVKLTVLFFWSLLALLLVAYWKICSGKWRFLAIAALLLPFWPDPMAGLMGIGGRVSALFVLLALPLVIVMGDELSASRLFLPWLDGAWPRRLAALAAAITVAVAPVRMQAYDKLLLADDYATYEQVVAELRHDQMPMLIAHRGLDFFYSYRLRRDAFHFDPEPNWDRSQIWRVAVRITPEEVAYYSPPVCPWGQTARLIPGTDYVLVREDCWEQLRARLNRNDNPDLYTEVWENMENPAQTRPAFLRARHGDFGVDPFSARSGNDLYKSPSAK